MLSVSKSVGVVIDTTANGTPFTSTAPSIIPSLLVSLLVEIPTSIRSESPSLSASTSWKSFSPSTSESIGFTFPIEFASLSSTSTTSLNPSLSASVVLSNCPSLFVSTTVASCPLSIKSKIPSLSESKSLESIIPSLSVSLVGLPSNSMLSGIPSLSSSRSLPSSIPSPSISAKITILIVEGTVAVPSLASYAKFTVPAYPAFGTKVIVPLLSICTIPFGSVIFCSLPVKLIPLILIILKSSPVSISVILANKSKFAIEPAIIVWLFSGTTGTVLSTSASLKSTSASSSEILSPSGKVDAPLFKFPFTSV